MQLRDSIILNYSINKLLPLIMMFSFYMFAYGGNFPGGGFQAGVIFGTIIIIVEVLFEYEIKADLFYRYVEIGGILILLALMILGIIYSGYPFDFYHLRGGSLLFSNVTIFLLNLAIYLEVSGSIILIFRNFIRFDDEKKNI